MIVSLASRIFRSTSRRAIFVSILSEKKFLFYIPPYIFDNAKKNCIEQNENVSRATLWASDIRTSIWFNKYKPINKAAATQQQRKNKYIVFFASSVCKTDNKYIQIISIYRAREHTSQQLSERIRYKSASSSVYRFVMRSIIFFPLFSKYSFRLVCNLCVVCFFLF